MTTPKYLVEFPDFDDAASAERLLAAGWADESWHNESCPNFTAGIFRCWIDFIDSERREEPGTPYRFTLEIENPDDHVMSGHVGDFDTLDEVIAKRDALLPETLAKVFADSLRAQLTGAQWDDMREANVGDVASDTCASHDYLDANMVMDPAFTLTVGHQIDLCLKADVELWGAAWSIAKANFLTANADEPAPHDVLAVLRDAAAFMEEKSISHPMVIKERDALVARIRALLPQQES